MPALDASISFLPQRSMQYVAGYCTEHLFVGRTQPSDEDRRLADAPPLIPRWAIWLNVLWFSGLILSLASASIGIAVKQWLNEYSSGLSGTSRPVARLRQYRLSNLKAWRVEDIVGLIPVLLQLSVSCFLAGLISLVWTLHHAVAITTTTLIGLLALFTAVTTLLSLFNDTCAYLSPQVRALESVWKPGRIVYRAYRLPTDLRAVLRIHPHAAVGYALRSLGIALRLIYDRHLVRHAQAVMKWISDSAVDNSPRQTWQGRERSAVSAVADELDIQILVEAYSSTLHPDALSAATVCLMDLRGMLVLQYFRKLHRSIQEHFGRAGDSEDGPLALDNSHKLLWVHIFLCVFLQGHEVPLSEDEITALSGYLTCALWSPSTRAADAKWAISTICAIMDHIDDKDPVSKLFVESDQLPEALTSIVHHLAGQETLTARVLTCAAVAGVYRIVRLTQLQLTESPSSDDPKAAYTKYIKSVDWFLRCANRTLMSSLPSEDLDIARIYTQDVLTGLTRVLLDVLTAHGVRGLRNTVDADALWNTLWRLAKEACDDVLQCIPDGIVPDALRMADILAAAPEREHGDDYWVEDMRSFGQSLREALTQVKGNLEYCEQRPS